MGNTWRLRVGTVLAGAAVSLAGCNPLGGSGTAGPAASGYPGGSAGGPGLDAPGVPAKSLTCDRFAYADLAAAVDSVVPSAKVGPHEGSVDDSGDGRQCWYVLYTAGTDLSSADYGLVELLVEVQDTWADDVVLDGNRDGEESRDAYTRERDSAKSADNGTAENNAIGRYADAPGIGDAAYLEDVNHVNDDGSTAQWTVDIEALRHPRPYRLHVGLSYVVPQPDQAVPDPSLDQAMADRDHRADLVQALAKAVLAKLPA